MRIEREAPPRLHVVAQEVHEGWPTVDQYLMGVLQMIPRALTGDPGSREFRAALRVVSERTGILPTRAETVAAMRRLADRGIVLPRGRKP
jgi:hypothetical protein